jgi:hypothetical protein
VRGYVRRASRRAPRFRAMSDAAKELWYFRVDQIRQGKSKRDMYRHHPLTEATVFISRGV